MVIPTNCFIKGKTMKTEWKDTTEYSRNDTERTPANFTLDCGFKIVVHRHIHYPPNTWLVTCNTLGIERYPLKEKGIDQAKEEAIIVCGRTIKKLKAAIDSVVSV